MLKIVTFEFHNSESI